MTLVIFDCDGVLVDSEIISATQLIAALEELEVRIDLAYVAQHFLGRSYPVVMQQIREEFGVHLAPEFETEYRARLLAAFEQDLKIIPHVAEVIERLALPYCAATSSSRPRAERSLEIVGLAGAFAGRLHTASEVARGKPAPDLFLHVAERHGVAPGDCLVLEDSLNGIRAARAAGMAVWRFTGGSHLGETAAPEPPDAVPDLRFASFAEFPDLVERHLADGKSAFAPRDGQRERRSG